MEATGRDRVCRKTLELDGSHVDSLNNLAMLLVEVRGKGDGASLAILPRPSLPALPPAAEAEWRK